VLVGFSLDRSGMVLTQTVDTSSGHASLDAAALDMLDRAQPLPAPPPEIAGAVVQLTVPVRFFLN
jgi:periplasmic protein TonB